MADRFFVLTRKEARKQERRIKKIVGFWVKPLGLLWWQRIDINYYDSSEEFIKDNGELETVMRTTCDWTRLWAEIDVNLPAVKRTKDEALEYMILHELAHVMVSPMQRRKKGDVEEFTVTRLAQAFLWLRDEFKDG